MESSFGLLLVLLTLTIIHIVQAQDQQGIGYLLCSMYIILFLRSAVVLMVNVYHVC